MFKDCIRVCTALSAINVVAAPAIANDVLLAQKYLVKLGYSVGAIDGVWGKNTRSALTKFLAENSDKEFDGVLDENELQALTAALGLPSSDPSGLVGEFSQAERLVPTTHFKPDEEIENLYTGFARYLNGEFDFPSLRILPSDFEKGRLVGNSKTDSSGYYFRTMVQYGDFGDLDGDGDNDLVVGGWRADGKNSAARLHRLLFDEGKPIKSFESKLTGTANVWTEDFDKDGVAETFTVGFLDSPVKPTQSIYFGKLGETKVSVGPAIDSHESNLVDFDGDGDLDIVAISYGQVSDNISVFEYDNESFKHRYLSLGVPNLHGSSIELADFDNDGDLELVIGDAQYPKNDGGIWLFDLLPTSDKYKFRVKSENKVAEQYFKAPEFRSLKSKFALTRANPSKKYIENSRSHDILLRAVDIDDDGDLDLLNSSLFWHDLMPMGVLQILVNDGFGNFEDETHSRLFNFQRSSEAAHTLFDLDVNGDGYVDLVLSERSSWVSDYFDRGIAFDHAKVTSGNKILLNDGTGHFIDTHHGVFAEISVRRDWPNSWFPVPNTDGTITFVSLFRTDGGLRDLWQFAKLKRPLSTGPEFTNPSEMGVPGFNEFFVLRTNQAAREAVLSGQYKSALDWFKGERKTIQINAHSNPTSCLAFVCSEVSASTEEETKESETDRLRRLIKLRKKW